MMTSNMFLENRAIPSKYSSILNNGALGICTFNRNFNGEIFFRQEMCIVTKINNDQQFKVVSVCPISHIQNDQVYYEPNPIEFIFDGEKFIHNSIYDHYTFILTDAAYVGIK
jgi:hypothetical protein